MWGKTTCKLLFILISVAVFASSYASVSAATIHGTVYDLSLEPIDAFVEINTKPNQFYVAPNGEYSFEVSPGKYVLMANSSEGTAIEQVEIIDEGEFVIDLVIGLELDEPIDFEDPELNDGDISESPTNSIFKISTGIIVLILLVGMIFLLFVQSRKADRSKDKKTDQADKKIDSGENFDKIGSDTYNKVLDMIRKNSRITQKDIRKAIPYSEAKISLIVSELESEGKIKKIRKGRGNILVYLKD